MASGVNGTKRKAYQINDCLNPSSNGIWLRGELKTLHYKVAEMVLILLLMEYGFGVLSLKASQGLTKQVLILLLMEYGFGAIKEISSLFGAVS